MRLPKIFLLALTSGSVALAQLPTYHVGRAPSQEELRALDDIVGPAGKELPAGRGTAKEGAQIFVQKCVVCHGPNLEGSKVAPKLVGGLIHPFATTIWSFINTSMPRNIPDVGLRDGTLTTDEVYSLTAYILYKNNIIKENDVLDAQSLPRVHMPARDQSLDRLAPR
jgi:S-disulfanyl-L-cysteine oxidoreductase SoxD